MEDSQELLPQPKTLVPAHRATRVAGRAMKLVPVELNDSPVSGSGTIVGKAPEPYEKGAGDIQDVAESPSVAHVFPLGRRTLSIFSWPYQRPAAARICRRTPSAAAVSPL